MKLDDLTIGEAKELAAMLGGNANAAKRTVDHGLQIVICDRGFVYIGQTTTDGEWCRVTGAQNIRYWGTKNGLGELAEKGPQPETKIDSCGDLKIPMRALIGLMDVKVESWKKR